MTHPTETLGNLAAGKGQLQTKTALVEDFQHIRRDQVAQYGGKNASLGEMTNLLTELDIRVPPGFATSSALFRQFVSHNNLEVEIKESLRKLSSGVWSLQQTGTHIRQAFLAGRWPDSIAKAITQHYQQFCQQNGQKSLDVAVRSSATAEDLPDASFAGQQETFLNIRGERALLDACQRCFASLFTDRAISYREAKGFDHLKVALSVGIQMMARSDKGCSGVMFSIDTETGFDKMVVINGAWGLGESVVQGSVDPDEYRIYKPFLADAALMPLVSKQLGSKLIKMIYSQGEQTIKTVPTSTQERQHFVLSDSDALALARNAVAIESHYGCPMDIEWAKDGINGALFIVQARPETVQSRRDINTLKTFSVTNRGDPLVEGISVGGAAVTGTVCMISDPADIEKFVDGSILVTENTDPDWVPIMKRAAAIVTDHGGRTSHAAIVSRELGLPAVVGTGDASNKLHDQQEITVSCAEGDRGLVYAGFANIEITDIDIADIPKTQTKVMLNLANPGAALRWWQLPADGVGLARMEFVISNYVKAHPMALIHPEKVASIQDSEAIDQLTLGYADKSQYFVDTLSRALAQIACVAYPNPVIVRMSDFKTNEYANLLGGRSFEPIEHNPMIGFRGASRYYSPLYREGFALECQAIRRLRDELGFNNVLVMVPFCRTIKEAEQVLAVMAKEGLVRGENGLQVYMMCEVPSNVILAKRFAQHFDGFSIGSNDLTQLTLGVDRDSDLLGELFDEQDDAVKWMLENVIDAAKQADIKIGICGQAPSDHPEFAGFLVNAGIDSISVTPDSFLAVKQHIYEAECLLENKRINKRAGGFNLGTDGTGR
jgi:pyruvate,water dikinase